MSQAVEPVPSPSALMRFGRVVNAMPHLAWLSDPLGNVEFVNDPWTEYTGVTLQALVEGVKGIVHPD